MKEEKTYYFFLGIGGIGMSAIARYYLQRGEEVFGYDKTPSSNTRLLEEEGAKIIYQDKVNALPEEVLDKVRTKVIFTPAIPTSAELYQFFMAGYDMQKRAYQLGQITKETTNLSVAGTHGKTTTSCILASIFKHSDFQFSAFLGGISADLGSNYFYQEGSTQHFSITEADEFDRSFLQLNPHGAVLTSTDADHLDIYKEREEMEKTYALFAGLISEPTRLFRAEGTQLQKGQTYSVDGISIYTADVKRVTPEGSHFSILKNKQVELDDLYLNLPGKHNLENAIGASLLAKHVGVGVAAIREGLAQFSGIKRRFETLIKRDDFVYIDDYAHHPSEIRAIVSSVKNIYKGKKVTAVFQPHLFSRTQDFLMEFAAELSEVDELILLPIYPAREEPIEGVTSERILELATCNKVVLAKEDLLAHLQGRELEVLLTLGAGDIDRLVEPIREAYA